MVDSQVNIDKEQPISNPLNCLKQGCRCNFVQQSTPNTTYFYCLLFVSDNGIRDQRFLPLCKECLKLFSSQSHLRRHSVIHTGARPFPCPSCDARFNNKGNMRRHFLAKHSTGQCHTPPY